MHNKAGLRWAWFYHYDELMKQAGDLCFKTSLVGQLGNDAYMRLLQFKVTVDGMSQRSSYLHILRPGSHRYR